MSISTDNKRLSSSSSTAVPRKLPYSSWLLTSNSSSPTMTLKVLIIGDSGVGKTAFVQQVCRNKFAEHKSSVGVDLSARFIDLPQCNARVKLQLWDIAGHERTHKFFRIYYRDAHAAILMFDISNLDSLRNVSKWKTELDSHITTADGRTSLPCLLVGNKVDLSMWPAGRWTGGLPRNEALTSSKCSPISPNGEEFTAKTTESAGCSISQQSSKVSQEVAHTVAASDSSANYNNFVAEELLLTHAESDTKYPPSLVNKISEDSSPANEQICRLIKELNLADCVLVSAKNNLYVFEAARLIAEKALTSKVLTKSDRPV